MNITRSRSQVTLRVLVAVAISLPSGIGLFAMHSGSESNTVMASESVASDMGGMMDHCLSKAKDEDVARNYHRTLAQYRLPDVTLAAMDGNPVRIVDVLEADHPVMLNFIYTSCNTICPVLSSTFAQVRTQLGQDSTQVRYVSISIDPEQDTPATLSEYAQRYGADENWRFFTGTLDDVIVLQRAFDAYRGNKMSHQPLTFLRLRAGGPWLRIEGFPKASDLIREYRILSEMDPASVHSPG